MLVGITLTEQVAVRALPLVLRLSLVRELARRGRRPLGRRDREIHGAEAEVLRGHAVLEVRDALLEDLAGLLVRSLDRQTDVATIGHHSDMQFAQVLGLQADAHLAAGAASREGLQL